MTTSVSQNSKMPQTLERPYQANLLAGAVGCFVYPLPAKTATPANHQLINKISNLIPKTLLNFMDLSTNYSP